MLEAPQLTDVAKLPLAPKNPLPYRHQLRAVRSYIDGIQELLDAGGPVTRLVLGPKWLLPTAVLIASPQGARDVLGRTDEIADRGGTISIVQMRRLMGGNLLDLPHDQWLPRRRTLQPMFTKQRVARYAGHMAAASQTVVDGWETARQSTWTPNAARSPCARSADRYSGWTSRPGPKPSGRHCAPRSHGSATGGPAGESAALAAHPRSAAGPQGQCRIASAGRRDPRCGGADPARDAPLVRALMTAADPRTGRPLSDDDICHELVLFILAGHDTTSTTLTYSLWALGHHPGIQDRVFDEVSALGDRTLTPDDVPRLGHTVRVLHEALRLCPPGAATPRLLKKDLAVDGYRLEAGTMVAVSFYALHRDPKLWDDPLKFDPDRFLPERSQGRSRWQYLPFGGGPRSCIGDHFAMLEATLALATIIRAARIESLDDDFPLATPFTVVAAAPIKARVHARTSTRRGAIPSPATL